MSCYYLVSSLSMGATDPWNPWYGEFRATQLCPACLTPKPELQAVDVYVDSKPENIPLNFVGGVLISYARRDFLECLGMKEVTRALHLGRVYNSRGVPYENFLTFRGKSNVYVRGGPKSEFRACEQCGARLYRAVGKKYILASRLSDNPLYDSDSFAELIVNEALCERIRSRKWKHLDIEELEVLDTPIDGRDDLAL